VYGSKKWAMAEMDMKILSTWQRKILRSIWGPVVQQGLWRIITNQQLRKLHKYLDIGAYIKKEKTGMDWSCGKMDQGRTVTKISESKPDASRRPRVRLLEDVEKDQGEMKVKRWRQKAVDREEWESVIREAKALRGPQSQGVSKYQSYGMGSVKYSLQIFNRFYTLLVRKLNS
jgi:hypothetical protein